MGQIIASVTGLDPMVGLLVGAAVIILYTTVGGLLGDVITDIVQGTILIVSLAVLLIVVLASQQFSLGSIKPEQLTLIGLGDDGQPQSLLATLDAWMVPILGSLVAQEAISRFLGATDAIGGTHRLLLGGGDLSGGGLGAGVAGAAGNGGGVSAERAGRVPAGAGAAISRSDHVCDPDGRDRFGDPLDGGHDVAGGVGHRDAESSWSMSRRICRIPRGCGWGGR